ncbi:MAG: hypothetical protein LBU40_02855 [Methanobrevibacter sp.]|jgi:hypothetical protein|nr:hypothetical protein [Methanobrevibacter sp.]
MQSNTTLRSEAMRILIDNLGLIETEKFLHDIKTDRFDYTQWRQNLWEDKTVEEIYNKAVKFQKQKNKNK